MAFSFHDLDGNAYYSFPKEVAIPVIRLGKLQELYTWLSAGLSGTEIEKLLDAADKALTGIVSGDKKGLAKAGFVISEMKDRKGMVVHPEIYYQIIAAQVIRHDEKVNEWNNDIQVQKVEAFKRMDAESDVFFLATQELLQQLNLSNITRTQFQDLLKESQLKIKALEEMMQRL